MQRILAQKKEGLTILIIITYFIHSDDDFIQELLNFLFDYLLITTCLKYFIICLRRLSYKADIISGGNFGWDNKKQISGAWSRFVERRKRNWKMFSVNAAEALPVELAYWKCFLKNMPRRIRYRTL
jgi:hypothetical protein